VRIGTVWLDDLRSGAARPLSAREAGRVAASNPSGERRLVVSLDGPASSGKSTVGAAAAAKLGYRFCDTGMMYRALTWLALERGVGPADPEALVALLPHVELAADDENRFTRVLVDGEDVTERVRAPDVDRHVSEVARQSEVRAGLLPRQRELADTGGIIVAGRDIGTVVLPDADLKLFLRVSLGERARRRADERGMPLDGEAAAQLEEELRRRDEIDTKRTTAPLRIPDGATIIESDGNTLEQTVDAVVRAIRERAQALGPA
jgi:cytidylate kinase